MHYNFAFKNKGVNTENDPNTIYILSDFDEETAINDWYGYFCGEISIENIDNRDAYEVKVPSLDNNGNVTWSTYTLDNLLENSENSDALNVLNSSVISSETSTESSQNTEEESTQTTIESTQNSVIKSNKLAIEKVQDLRSNIIKMGITINFSLSYSSTSYLLPKEQSTVNNIYKAIDFLRSAITFEIGNLINAARQHKNLDDYLKLDLETLNSSFLNIENYRIDMVSLQNANENEKNIPSHTLTPSEESKTESSTDAETLAGGLESRIGTRLWAGTNTSDGPTISTGNGQKTDTGDEPLPSTSTESTIDAGTDQKTDTGNEPSPSTSTESTIDAGTDQKTDTGDEQSPSTSTESTIDAGTDQKTDTGDEPSPSTSTEPTTTSSVEPKVMPNKRSIKRQNINITQSRNVEHLTTETPPIDDIPEILPADNYEQLEPIESFEPINEANKTIVSEDAKGNSALNAIGIAAGIGAAAGAGIYVAKKLKNNDKKDDDDIYGVDSEIPSLEEQYSSFNKHTESETVEKYKSTANTDRKDE